MILAALAIVLAAIAYIGFNAKPQPQGDSIPIM